MDNREIVKRRLRYGIAGSLLFVCLGYYLFSIGGSQALVSKNVVEIIAVVAMVFFGCTAIISIKKLLDNKS